ncbi:hypothetical protein [Komagataeibacter kakiaceti]|nr:hypothetical protein [Komagataeibacter kakiaceti]
MEQIPSHPDAMFHGVDMMDPDRAALRRRVRLREHPPLTGSLSAP